MKSSWVDCFFFVHVNFVCWVYDACWVSHTKLRPNSLISHPQLRALTLLRIPNKIFHTHFVINAY